MQPLHRFLPALAAAATLVLPLIATGSAFAQDQQDQQVHKAHAIAMHGEPKIGTDAPYFDHVNPTQPKGGTLPLSAHRPLANLYPFNSQDAAGAGSEERSAGKRRE